MIAAAGACFALTFLLSAARFPWGLSPFYLGAYTSFLALGGEYFSLSVGYMLARLASGGDTLSLLSAAFASAGAGIVRLIALITAKRFHPFYAVISAFFAELFTLFFLPTSYLFPFLGNSALSCLFALLCLRFALRSRKRIVLFGGWEIALCFLFSFAFGAGAYGVRYFGITPYYLLISALLPLSSVLGVGGGAIPLAFALGGTAVSGELLLPLGAALGLVLCEALKSRRQAAACAFPVAEALLYLIGAARFSLLNLPLMISGAIVAAFLPDSFYRKCAARLGRCERSAAHAVVNKARLELGGKLGYVGDALRKMSESLFLLNGDGDAEKAAGYLSEEFSQRLCAGCSGYKDCAAQGGEGTAPLFAGVIARALEQGRASICDLPPYLNGNCRKRQQILDQLNEAAALYQEERERSAFVLSERERMASEAEGIAGILDVMKKDMRRVLTFDGKREHRIVAELQREGITAYDAMVTEKKEEVGVTVTMEESKADDPRVLRAVSRAMETPLVAECVTGIGAGAVSVGFVSAPIYDAIVGEAVRIKEGSAACGDTKSVTRLGSDRMMIALSDGMGSGEEANDGSSAAISLVENFYRTGVDERVVLPLINRLLTMRNNGGFQTLDMCVINLRTGEADFIKLSAPESVIKRKEGSEIVESGALPLGILREVRPAITRKQLSSGDVVVLATDGVTDAIGADGMVRILESGRTNNPQTIADNLIRDASYVSAADDQTVVALRLFRRL